MTGVRILFPISLIAVPEAAPRQDCATCHRAQALEQPDTGMGGRSRVWPRAAYSRVTIAKNIQHVENMRFSMMDTGDDGERPIRPGI